MSDSISVIHQGEVVKYHIDIENVTGFTQASDNFRVIIRYGMEGKSKTIERANINTDTEGRFFFSIDTAEMVGKVYIECQMEIPDDDYTDGYRTEVDTQLLCFVAATTCPKLMTCSCSDENHNVTYTRTRDVSLQIEYFYLKDANGNNLTSTEEDGSHPYLLVLRPAS